MRYSRRNRKQRQGGMVWIAALFLLALTVISIGACSIFSSRGEVKVSDSMPGSNVREDQQETFIIEIITDEISDEKSRYTEAESKEDLLEDKETEEETSKEEIMDDTKLQYLPSLSGLAPGTVISSEKIDFNNLDSYFMSWIIEEDDNLYDRIIGKSYRKNDYIGLSELRYLKMPHYNFNGQIQVGELVVNAAIEDDVKAAFKELFQAGYQIESMYLIDNYWTGDPDSTDSASIDVNNTSAFCFRNATGSGNLSNHAYGRAIDINPQQNPYVSYASGSPKWSHENANDYIDRSTGLPHVITHDDLAYKVFTKYGFTWGGDWNSPKDYQHFEKKR